MLVVTGAINILVFTKAVNMLVVTGAVNILVFTKAVNMLVVTGAVNILVFTKAVNMLVTTAGNESAFEHNESSSSPRTYLRTTHLCSSNSPMPPPQRTYLSQLNFMTHNDMSRQSVRQCNTKLRGGQATSEALCNANSFTFLR